MKLILITIDCLHYMDLPFLPKADDVNILESQCGNTNVAMTTMFTGLSPFQHGITRIRGDNISDSIIAFPEFIKREQHLKTFAWVGNSVLQRNCNPHFVRWFDIYDDNFNSHTNPCELFDVGELECPNLFAWIHFNDLHYVEPDKSVRTLQESLVLRSERLNRISKVIARIFERSSSKDFKIITGDHPDSFISPLSPFVGHADYMSDLSLPVATYGFSLCDKKRVIRISQKELLRVAYNRLKGGAQEK